MSQLCIAMENLNRARQIAYPSTPEHNVSPWDSDSFEHMLQSSPTMSHQRGAIHQDALNSLNLLLLNPWSMDAPTFQATMGVPRMNENRKKSAKHYNRYKKRKNLAQCSITGIWGDCNKETIEKAYDQLRLCIVLHDPDGGGNKVTLRILDLALKDEIVDGTMTFGALAGNPFDLPEGGENNEGPLQAMSVLPCTDSICRSQKKELAPLERGLEWNRTKPYPIRFTTGHKQDYFPEDGFLHF
ncbi:hypothetical protein SEMRO_2364_G324990.1 [Seminavis robusta]|uniref:Uncharacterized protein n=1 Tax=Seminavis robusta TaxID=568900 RepID=A0A9N8EVJ3_9STRA|nr:hypothetical protein SEMRO_2364_G324990.1 [Seminavis robusta]|eukprot:Sro2364_g324990.1 n/a (242) ;mRNA; f:10475-11308